VDGLRNGPFVAWRAQLQRAMRPPRVVLPVGFQNAAHAADHW
jgi:hypothetical protein